MYECFNLNTPTMVGVIAETCKNPEILICKNDKRSTLLGQFKSQSKENRLENDKAVVADGHHPGVSFFPPAVKIEQTLCEDGPGMVRHYFKQNKVQYFNKPSTLPYRIDEASECDPQQHKHPMRYAMRAFALSVYQNLPSVVFDTNTEIFVGTIEEAMTIKYYTGKDVRSITWMGLMKAKEDNPNLTDEWLLTTGVVGDIKFGFSTKFKQALITSNNYAISLWKNNDETMDQMLFHPCVNYIKLLRDNSNRAMLYNFPKIDTTTNTMSMRLVDRNNKTSSYILPYTPTTEAYHIVSFAQYYKRHPMWLNKSKADFLSHQLSVLHYLQVAMINMNPVAMIATHRFYAFDEHDHVLPLPVMQPYDKDALYEEFSGTPYIVDLKVAGQTAMAHNINYITRKAGTMKMDIAGCSANFRAILLCFCNDGFFTVAKVLADSIVTVNNGLSEHLASVLERMKYFTTVTPGKRVCSGPLDRGYYYVRIDGALADIAKYVKGEDKHGKAINTSIAFPFTSVKVAAIVKNYFYLEPNERNMDGMMGILDVAEIVDIN